MKMKLAILFLLGSGLLAACDLDEAVVRGSGDIVSLEQDLSDFDSVDASLSFEVDIRQGENYSVVIRIDDNLQDDLVVRVRDNTLEIGFDRNVVTTNTTMEADITMPQLRAISLSGAADGRISGFNSENSFSADLSGSSSLSGAIASGDVNLDLSGSSEVSLDGSGNDLEIDASGASDVDLLNFPVDDASLNLSGSSQVGVHVNGTLDVSASGSSDVTYSGNPSLGNISTSGSSSVSRE